MMCFAESRQLNVTKPAFGESQLQTIKAEEADLNLVKGRTQII